MSLTTALRHLVEVGDASGSLEAGAVGNRAIMDRRRRVGTPPKAWLPHGLGGTRVITMGDRGRLEIPADIRARSNLAEGTDLVVVDSGCGIVLLTREQLRDRVRSDLAGLDLVGELLSERAETAAMEDSGA